MKGVTYIYCAALLGAISAGQVASEGLKVRHKYVGTSGSISLIGVCSANDQGGTCWGPDGRKNADLTRRFDAAFKSGRITWSYRYGFKTRVAFFNTVPAAGSQNFYPSLQAESSSSGYMDTSGVFSDSTGSDRYQAVSFVVPNGTVEGTVRTTVTQALGTSPRLKLTEGEKMDFLGSTFEVARIGTEAVESAREVSYGGIGGKLWVVGIKASRSGTRLFSTNWSVVGLDGLTVRIVDAEGKPAFVDPSVVSQQGYRPGQETKPKYFASRFGNEYGGMGNSGEIMASTNVNPKEIKEVFFTASESKTVTITGIPLDPVK